VLVAVSVQQPVQVEVEVFHKMLAAEGMLGIVAAVLGSTKAAGLGSEDQDNVAQGRIVAVGNKVQGKAAEGKKVQGKPEGSRDQDKAGTQAQVEALEEAEEQGSVMAEVQGMERIEALGRVRGIEVQDTRAEDSEVQDTRAEDSEVQDTSVVDSEEGTKAEDKKAQEGAVAEAQEQQEEAQEQQALVEEHRLEE